MKEYRGTEIIKASRWLQDMSHEREVIEKIIPLTKVQVEDRSAKVFFEGEHDGKLLTVIVTVPLRRSSLGSGICMVKVCSSMRLEKDCNNTLPRRSGASQYSV